MSDPTAATGVPPGGNAKPAPRPRYKRKLSNYLLDKKLQLRYVLLVTILSGVISGSLGYLIYQQRHAASSAIEGDLAALTQDDKTYNELREVVAADYRAEDRALMYKMVGVGVGLVVILSLYLLIMTHKVAGPLYKVSMYFDRMADGRLGKVTLYLSKMREGRYDKVWNLRKGDQLVDFYEHFKTAHAGVVTMEKDDIAKIKDVIAAAEAAGAGDHASVVELRTILARKEKSVE